MTIPDVPTVVVNLHLRSPERHALHRSAWEACGMERSVWYRTVFDLAAGASLEAAAGLSAGGLTASPEGLAKSTSLRVEESDLARWKAAAAATHRTFGDWALVVADSAAGGELVQHLERVLSASSSTKRKRRGR